MFHRSSFTTALSGRLPIGKVFFHQCHRNLTQSREAGFVTFLYEKSIPILQDVARDYPFDGDDVCRFPLLLRQVKILFTNAASMLATKRFAHGGTDLAQWPQQRLENVGFKAALIFSQSDETNWFSICIGDG